jgi:hypothetical protein
MFFSPSHVSHSHLLPSIPTVCKAAPHLQIQVCLHHLICHQFQSCHNLHYQSIIQYKIYQSLELLLNGSNSVEFELTN